MYVTNIAIQNITCLRIQLTHEWIHYRIRIERTYVENAQKEIGVTRIDNQPICDHKIKKDQLVDFVEISISLLDKLASILTTDFKTATDSVNNLRHESQKMMIVLQNKLLASRNEQLELLDSTVKKVGWGCSTGRNSFLQFSSPGQLYSHRKCSRRRQETEDIR